MKKSKKPAQTLASFIDDVYLPERQRINPRGVSRSVRYGCSLVVHMIAKHIGKMPLVSDLNSATLEAICSGERGEWSAAQCRRVHDYFAALWRCAHAKDLVSDRPLQPAERYRIISDDLRQRPWTDEELQLIAKGSPRDVAEKLGVTTQLIYNTRMELRKAKKELVNHGGPGKEPLSMAPGTLNQIMVEQYFARNLRIRKDKTRVAYDKALRDFRDSIGHEPTVADLSDDALIDCQAMMRRRELAPKTINERIGRIVALWTWLAKKRLIHDFPAVTPIPEPKRAPVAWTQEELARLFESCAKEAGHVSGIPAAKWWLALHAVIWDSGARIGEVLALRWEWIDWKSGYVTVLAEVRKGGMQDMVYSLHPDTLAMLKEIRQPERELIFPWIVNQGTLYNHYRRILKRAGLPAGRKDKFHKIRRSVASHLQAAGVDASSVLAHSSSVVTRESYLDPKIVNTRKTHDVLFRNSQSTPAPVSKSVSVADADALAFL